MHIKVLQMFTLWQSHGILAHFTNSHAQSIQCAPQNTIAPFPERTLTASYMNLQPQWVDWQMGVKHFSNNTNNLGDCRGAGGACLKEWDTANREITART